MTKAIVERDFRRFTIYEKAVKERLYKWPLKPRGEIPYADPVKEFTTSRCKFNLFSS